MVDLILNEKLLRQKCSPVNLKDGESILNKLRETLNVVQGYGLAAPQINIQKNVALVKVKDATEIPMVNPVIIDAYDSIINQGEGCLSFPNVRMDTNRFNYVHVKDDLHPEGFICEGTEAVAVQHEIDHLSGILFMDRAVKNKEKVGRNEPCPCGSGKKYKKCCGAA